MKRRSAISPKPFHRLNLWSIMRNCIGKDLSRIPIPVSVLCVCVCMLRASDSKDVSLCVSCDRKLIIETKGERECKESV